MKKVEISFVLDETGSMEMLRSDTIGSFNTFIEDQKKLKADVTFSLTLFSLVPGEDTYRVLYKNVPLADVEPLSLETYRPRGSTPLLDAVGGTIDSLGTRLANMSEDERPNQVIVVILTDGLENSSHEYTSEKVKKMVEHQRDVYKWEFVFLGVGLDTFTVENVAIGMGMPAAAASSYAPSAGGTRMAYQNTSKTVRRLVEDDDDDEEWASSK